MIRHGLCCVMAFVVLVAAACGGGDSSTTAEPTTSPAAEEPSPTAVDQQPTADPTSAPADADDSGDSGDGGDSADGGDGDDGEATEPATTPTPLPEPTVQPTPTAVPSTPSGAQTVVVTYDSNSFGFEQRVVATFARDGSFRLDYDDGSIEILDASTASRTSSFFSGDELSVILDEGLGLGGPDAYWGVFLAGFGITDHVLSFAGTAFAGEGEVLGRQAILYETDVVPNAIGGGPDRVTAAVDTETGAMLDYLATFEGQEQASLVATSIEVFSEPLDVFTLSDLPAPSFSYTQGFQAVTLDQITGLVGYTPVLPTVVPDGYQLDALAVAPGQTDIFTGAEGSNPPSVDVVHARYRNGWRTFTVTTRRVGNQPEFWIDPFSGEGQFYERFDVEVADGFFAGHVAELSTAPETVPHLWVQGDELIFTVTGPLRDIELIDIVNSLQPG